MSYALLSNFAGKSEIVPRVKTRGVRRVVLSLREPSRLPETGILPLRGSCGTRSDGAEDER